MFTSSTSWVAQHYPPEIGHHPPLIDDGWHGDRTAGTLDDLVLKIDGRTPNVC